MMGSGSFQDLLDHVGHKIECVYYGPSKKEAANAALECVRCGVVLVDFDREEPDEPVEKPSARLGRKGKGMKRLENGTAKKHTRSQRNEP